jgi:multidrug efflux pump subunit AcrB
MHVLDMSFDLMTLGGLAAAVGLVIDDAMVVVENRIRSPLGWLASKHYIG